MNHLKVIKLISRINKNAAKNILWTISNIRRCTNGKIYHASRFPDVKIKNVNLYAYVAEKTKHFGNDIALVDTEYDKRYTYAQLIELSDRLAYGMCEDGLAKKDVVLACLPNIPEYVIIMLGVMSRGGVLSGVNPNYTETELKHHLRDSDAKFIFVQPENLSNILRAAANLGNQIKKIYVVGKTDLKFSTISTYHRVIQNTASVHLEPVEFDTKNDLALLPFSSGTTGLPKGIMISHRNFVSVLHMLLQKERFDLAERGQNSVGVIPFFHVFGMLQLFASLTEGSTLFTMSKFKLDCFLKTVIQSKASILCVVPPLMNTLVKDPTVTSDMLKHVNVCVSGAAPLGKSMVEKSKQKFPNMHIRQGYGMTEMSGVSHAMPKRDEADSKMGSCGMLLSNYNSKVVDVHTGAHLGFHETGELCVKSVTCMLGYYKNEKATSEAFDSDGFLHTGDLGYYDEDGYFYIVDRLKELIKVRGFQVAPAELEGILLNHDGIQDAAVIGISSSSDGEVPRAYVVPKSGYHLTERQVMDFVSSQVIYYKNLKGGVEFVEEIPKAQSGKILRRLLKRDYAEKVQQVSVA